AEGIAGFLSVQHKKKRPISLYRPPNVKELAIDRLLPTGQNGMPVARALLRAKQLPRAGLFLKTRTGLVALHEPNHCLDWVRWRFHDPPNLESQYQLALNFCQEKNAKSGIFFSDLSISSGPVAHERLPDSSRSDARTRAKLFLSNFICFASACISFFSLSSVFPRRFPPLARRRLRPRRLLQRCCAPRTVKS